MAASCNIVQRGVYFVGCMYCNLCELGMFRSLSFTLADNDEVLQTIRSQPWLMGLNSCVISRSKMGSFQEKHIGGDPKYYHRGMTTISQQILTGPEGPGRLPTESEPYTKCCQNCMGSWLSQLTIITNNWQGNTGSVTKLSPRGENSMTPSSSRLLIQH